MVKTITINSSNNTNWQNTPETGDLEWTSGSWKDYWEEYSGKEWPCECCREGCTERAEHGAHIGRLHSKTVYIVPLCGNHNPRSREPASFNPYFSLKIGSVLVNADDESMDKTS